MAKVVGVRFGRGCKVYDFDAGLFVLDPGDKVIVETEHGLVLGEVAVPPRPVPEPDEGRDDAGEHPELKSVYRLATEEDLKQQDGNKKLEEEAFQFCLERVAARTMEMNLVKVECLFDRSKIIFYFTAEGRLDFRELVRDLVGRFRTRIEMRQIGVRHEAKLLGGLGSCGRELCCATFLKDFEPVSVKMAKEQNLSLNPTKISGLCGRLMCCLTYEFPAYQELKRNLPKVGKRITLNEDTAGKVVRQNVLKREITVYLDSGKEIAGTPEELAEYKDPQSSRPKPQTPPPPPKNPSNNKQQAKRPRGRKRRDRKGPGN